MARCRESRKARRRRDRRFVLRLAHKRFDDLAYRVAGVSPKYYDVIHYPVTRVINGMRYLDLRKGRFKVVPTAKCRALYRALAAMCQGVTVDLSGMRRDDGA